MKCKNCGAELNNGRCEYCGSVFAEDMRLYTLKEPKFDDDLLMKLLHESPILGGKTPEVTTLSDSEPHYIEGV